jgi:pyruvate dehydrogenase E1 component
MELPGVLYAEPAFARELEWILLDHLRSMQEPDGESLYLRLTTKPLVQAPFTELVERRGEEAVRQDVLAGAYWLREPSDGPDTVIIATCGAIVPEVLEAALALERDEGISAGVLCLSSPDRVYRDWRMRRLTHLDDISARRQPSHLESLVPASVRTAPIVTVLDGASHSLAWVGSALGMRSVPLGVDTYGQVGDLASVYDAYDLSPAAIVTAALIALEY